MKNIVDTYSVSNKRNIWIKAGYKEFARFGPDSLAVDRLAALVGKSRSSFYHLFGDRERYLEMLGDYHMAESRQVVMELDNATSFYPDFA
ncbi:MAG: TetR/AcrR family transcriptional regulator, partial [Bacteroidetes bacterium]|nr:TetR/AcrR family transcriptional regulator [Bacteroidota bacterium]